MDLGLWRFLETVTRELGAADARIELGGEAPTDPKLIWVRIPRSDARLVAVFRDAPESPAAAQEKLVHLSQSFSETVERATAPISSYPADGATARARLDAELTALATRAGSDCAFVSDLSSPVIWGVSSIVTPIREVTSEHIQRWAEQLRSEHPDDVRGAHGHVLRLTLNDERECLARLLGGLYVVVLVFGGALSEPAGVGALLHATQRIERLIVALPPLDPPPGGKVIRLPPRLR
ncbi:MAG TPA: hypothetical protein VHM70_11155 [Polyangiaceae bacterium]|jgi:hypothetical protein|nr:hypothetical protein [Polyangiaceae bacterium]